MKLYVGKNYIGDIPFDRDSFQYLLMVSHREANIKWNLSLKVYRKLAK